MRIFKKDLNWLILLTSFMVLFSLGFYILKFLPVNNNFSCSVGGNFNSLHLSLLAIFSLIFSTNLIYLKEVSFKKSRANAGLTGVALFLMTFSTLCTICLLPAISILGLSISLSILSIYNLYFQFIAIGLGFTSLYFLHRTYQNQCLFN